jgi:hypothetical protein
MANPHRGEVPFRLGAKEWIFRLDNNAICEIEAGLGRPLAEMGTMGFRAIREFLFVGLRAANKRSPGRLEIGDMMDPSKMEYYGDQVRKCIDLYMGESVGEEAGDDTDRPLRPVEVDDPTSAAG